MTDPADIVRGEPLNVREAHAALDLHMARAMKRGDDGCYADLHEVSALIDRQAEEIETLRSAGGQLMRSITEVRREIDGLVDTFEDKP